MTDMTDNKTKLKTTRTGSLWLPVFLWYNHIMKTILLASSSPRRIEMMKQHGLDPIIRPSDVSESLPIDLEPHIAVMYLALKKALHAQSQQKIMSPARILAADTIVVLDGRIIGKPKNKEEAFLTLSMLRKKPHHVITGVCVIDLETDRKTCFYDTSTVYFTDYSDEELQAYVNTKEPYDKAGGYAIQGTFGKYVDHIEGDRNNIIGLPWYRVEKLLK